MNSAITAVNILQRISAGQQQFDPSYQAILARATALGYPLPSAATQVKDNAFILSLKAGSNNWNKMDVAWMFATDDSDFATLNLKSPSTFQVGKVASPIFTPQIGFSGNASTMYLEAGGWNPSIHAVNFLRDNNSFGVYVMNNAITSGAMIMGAALTISSGQGNVLIPRHTGNITRALNNNGVTQSVGTGIITSVGLTSVVRTSSGSFQVFKNGVSIGTASVTSNAIVNLVWYLLAIRSNSNAVNFDGTHQLGFAFAGGATDQLEMYNSCVARLAA